jgi:hypothetical protein
VLLFVVVALSLRASRTNAQADSDPDAANPAKTPPGKYAANLPSTSYEEDPSSNATDASSSNLSLVNTNPKLVVEEQDKIEEKEKETSPSASSSPFDENLDNSSQTTDKARIVNPAASQIQSSSDAATSEILSLQPIFIETSSSNELQITEPQVIATAEAPQENMPPISSQSTSSLHVENPSSNAIDTSSSNLSLVNTNPEQMVEEQAKKEEKSSPSASSSPFDGNLDSSSNAATSEISSLHPIPTEGSSFSASQINESQVIETAVGNVTNEGALNLIHSVLGNDFDKFNNGVKFIDFSTAGDPPDAMPQALVDFCYACHPEADVAKKCTELPDGSPMYLPSDSTQSMYVRQKIIPTPQPTASNNLLFPSSVYCDTSCIISRPDGIGSGCGYYVCCNPVFLAGDDAARPTAAKFCQAFASEMGRHPALIVDVSGQREDYIQSWINHAGKERMPAAGVVDNVFPIHLVEKSSMVFQSFQLHEKDSKGQAIDNTSYRLTINGWTDGTNIASKDMQWLIGLIHAIVEKYGILAQVIHCSSGCGRAPTLALRSMVTDVARKAKEQGISCCFANEDNEQLQPCVNGHLNLAYVLRNAALSLVSSRGVAGWGYPQYQGDLEYVQSLLVES